MNSSQTAMNRDVFICHTSEDKQQIVRPLVQALTKVGISCWYDEAEIQWGNSIVNKINNGLTKSRFVIVVLSHAFLSKPWPQFELSSALNDEASTGNERVLPLVTGSSQESGQLISKYALLKGKRYLRWEEGLAKITESLLILLGRQRADNAESGRIDKGNSLVDKASIPLPTIRQQFTQLDKDRFLKDSFQAIRHYFAAALQALSERFADIEFDLEDVTSSKFICKVYRRGDLLSQCKIWLSSLHSSTSIAYKAGDVDRDSDSSWNESLTVNSTNQDLGLQAMMYGAFGMGSSDEKRLLTPERAAEYLWRMFTQKLSH